MRDKRFRKHALIAVFEGNDAAGKGGAIRRVAAALDPRQYRIVPIAAPTEEELAQPYLWRFWRHIPPRGKFTVFDRSWYGRGAGGAGGGLLQSGGLAARLQRNQ